MAPRRPCWLRERAGLWLAGNDITHSQSEQLSQPRCIFGKRWELGMEIQKVTKQSLLLNLALSRKRRLGSVQTLPVLITGGEGVPVTLVEAWWARGGRLLNCSFCSGQQRDSRARDPIQVLRHWALVP